MIINKSLFQMICNDLMTTYCTILISEVPLAFRMSGYTPSQVSYYIASALLATAMYINTKYTHCIIIASTGFDNVSGTSWTGLKSVSTSQLVPSWGRTIRCVDGRHYGEVLHEYQSQESTTLFCSVIPCHTAHWHIYIVCMMQREIPSRLAPRLIYKES